MCCSLPPLRCRRIAEASRLKDEFLAVTQRARARERDYFNPLT
jgi:hypothetical protein